MFTNNLIYYNPSKNILNEREYNFDNIECVDDKCKKNQVVIEDRLKFNDGFNYANTFTN